MLKGLGSPLKVHVEEARSRMKTAMQLARVGINDDGAPVAGEDNFDKLLQAYAKANEACALAENTKTATDERGGNLYFACAELRDVIGWRLKLTYGNRR